jgi:hypothetical protein
VIDDPTAATQISDLRASGLMSHTKLARRSGRMSRDRSTVFTGHAELRSILMILIA